MKRLISLILALAMLASLVCIGAYPVSAASSLSVSDQMVDIIKTLEGFAKKPYYDNTHYSVGYGTTPLTNADLDRYMREGISEEEGEQLLIYYLTEMGKEVNAFADKFGLKLTQGQFDAILSLTYNCGTAWLYKDSTLRRAIINRETGNELLFAFGQWSNSAGKISRGLVRRRLIECNVYLNNTYSMTVPDNLRYVIYNNNGGTGDIKVQCFDANTTVAPYSQPVLEGYTFAGWYTQEEGGTKITNLATVSGNPTIYAHWTVGTAAPEVTQPEVTQPEVTQPEVTQPEVTQPEVTQPEVTQPEVTQPEVTEPEVTQPEVTQPEVTEPEVTQPEVTQPEVTQPETTQPSGIQITVTADDVNIRKGPHITYSLAGRADRGDKFTVTATQQGGSYLWGNIGIGWIALKYTDYNKTQEETPNPVEPPKEEEEPTPVEPSEEEQKPAEKLMGTITGDSLRIRKGPSTGYTVVGYLNKGDRVQILDQKVTGSAAWAKIPQGWVSMTYVKLDSTQEEDNTDPPKDDTATQPPKDDTSSTPPQAPAKVMGTITGNSLRIRSGAGIKYSVKGYLNKGDRVEILAQKTVGSMTWGQTSKGWISMDYVKLDSASTTTMQTGKVADGGRLRVRTGPGSSYAIAGYLEPGTSVKVYETKPVGTVTWGRVDGGWVDMSFIRLDGQEEEKPEASVTQGTVTASSLHVRQTPGMTSKIVSRLLRGTKVEILQTRKVGTMVWGQTSQGWISMDYVEVES